MVRAKDYVADLVIILVLLRLLRFRFWPLGLTCNVRLQTKWLRHRIYKRVFSSQISDF